MVQMIFVSCGWLVLVVLQLSLMDIVAVATELSSIDSLSFNSVLVLIN